MSDNRDGSIPKYYVLDVLISSLASDRQINLDLEDDFILFKNFIPIPVTSKTGNL
ncbi:hypothetical protein [Calothrix sp. UHCC 0171]|uniref:hypothetical protein n=1 Tax=Calothrix sp. UHCC 0171 TaxID=3110245 RepID=UPI002B216495|nr:hypothetical protein [Calothrix sp. UHCC 0171]MEA5573925.1 hypothetical protein [Calothrix sp. UHCC 0171]